MHDFAWERFQLEVASLPSEPLPLHLLECPEFLLAPEDSRLLATAQQGTAFEVDFHLVGARAKHAVEDCFGPGRRGHQNVEVFVCSLFVCLMFRFESARVHVGAPLLDLLCCVMSPVVFGFENSFAICSEA